MKKLTIGFLVALFAFVLVACTASTYTVTFNTNSGSAIASVEVEEGSAFVQPASPTRDGFVFNGWYSDAALTTMYSFGTPVNEDTTIYAGWTAIAADEFVVSFNSADGSYVAPVVVTDGDAVAQPTAPVREGYTFQGWYLNDVAYDFASPVTANITLVAHWQQKGVTNHDATYYTYISDTSNMNPYSETLADSTTLYSLVSDALYEGDYDFEAARAQLVDEGVTGLPETVGFEEWYAAGHTADQLPFNYFPAMASSLPVDVNGDGTLWEVTIRSDLQFVDGTPITAQTFSDSYAYLLDPDLLNARATNLYEGDGLPLVNGRAYFSQNNPLKDDFGYTVYTVSGVEYRREWGLYGHVTGHEDWPLYYPAQEGPYAASNLVGPEGAAAYLEDWGNTYAVLESAGYPNEAETTMYLETEAGAMFAIYDVDGVNTLYAPEAGWTLNGVAVPVVADANPDDFVTYASAYPAYANEDASVLAPVGEDGIPVDGETVALPEVLWSEVGFEVTDTYTFRFSLTQRKTQWQVMTQLSSAILSVVHIANYENGMIEDGTRTNYGTIDNPLVSFGVYELIEWEPGAYYIFERNDAHYDADEYDIQFIRYDVISDQSVAVAEFIKGNLDVTGVSGDYFSVYENSDYLKLSPVTTFFRFAFGLDRDVDQDGNPDAPIMGIKDFRLALYFATDRETFVTDVNAPGHPTQGILGPLYYSSEMGLLSYRSSAPGIAVLAGLSPETYGFNPVMAKQYYDAAYAQAVTDGYITDGEVVQIELAIFNSETNLKMADWLESTWEDIFGSTFDLVINDVDGDTLDAIWDQGNFDITFGGWQGLQFWAPQMLQVYSDVDGAANILETGFSTGNAVVSVELAATKVAVTAWLAELEAIAEPTTSQQGYIDLYTEFLAGFTDDVWAGTYDYLWNEAYSDILLSGLAEYDGNLDDYDAITAALEGELLDQMINIPLFTRVGASVYSSRIVFDADTYHARMGWGGLKYMSIEVPAE